MVFRPIQSLDRYDVSEERGFLPQCDPLPRLPEAFDPWEQIGRELPKLLAAAQARRVLHDLPRLDTVNLHAPPQLERAMLLLSYFAHAYVWGQDPPADRLPANLAVPWSALAHQLGRPPVLSYASYALHNWRRLDASAPIDLGNIVLLQNFLGGVDEEWFILVHVDIEAKAAPILRALAPIQSAVIAGRAPEVTAQLSIIAHALESMYRTLDRMPERCDPYIYYNRVRPYLYGWKDQPALPQGLLYEGVEAFHGQRQRFRGETGAQSGIIPCLDALLGVEHKNDVLREYLREMRDYMPPGHRKLLSDIERGPTIRRFVADRSDPALLDAYDQCVHWVQQFRAKHLEYAANYIHKQSPQRSVNPTDIGTGGTPFMRYLKEHRDETGKHLLAKGASRKAKEDNR